DRRAGPSLRTVRQVQVLERLLRLRAPDPGLQLRLQLPLLLDRLQDRGAPVLQLLQIRGAVPDITELDLVQPARRLLPVSGDERERVPLVEERERGVDLPRRERQLVCDLPDQRIRKHEIQSS